MLLQQPGRGLSIARHADPQHDLPADHLHHLGHVPLTFISPRLDDADLVAHVGQLGQDVAGDHDRLAQLAQMLDDPADFDPHPRVQPAGRLVEQQHLRIVQQHAGQPQPLRHAAGKAGGQGIALVVQADQFEHFVANLPPRRAP